MGRLAQVRLEPDAGDFRLLDRQALDALRSLRERNRFLRGMTAWVGFRQATVDYDRDPRVSGETKFPLRKMLRFAADGVASFSHFPLQLATILGFLIDGRGVRRPAADRGRALHRHLRARRAERPVRGALHRRHPADDARGDRRVRGADLRGGQAPAAVRGPRRRSRVEEPDPEVDPAHAAHPATTRTHEGRGARRRGRGADRGPPADRRGPRVRRLRALAGPRRPGGDARRRGRPPPRALLPPPVHQRPRHRGAVRRARDAGRARVAAAPRWRSSSTAARGRSRRRPTCCASRRCRRPRALRMGLAVLSAAAAPRIAWSRSRRRRRGRGSSARWAARPTEKVWGPLLRGKFGDRADDISMAWLWSKLTLRRQIKGAEAREELLGYPRALVGAAVRRAARLDRGAAAGAC